MNRKRQILIRGGVAIIPLTRGYKAIIDTDDVPLVENHNWHVKIGKRMLYAARKGPRDADGKERHIFLHHALMSPPDGMSVDHVNCNGLDNRRSSNLRIATRSQCSQNQRRRQSNLSGVKGVHRQREKWQARIMSNGVRENLGLFDTIDEAAAAYAEASIRLHGAFARLK